MEEKNDALKLYKRLADLLWNIKRMSGGLEAEAKAYRFKIY